MGAAAIPIAGAVAGPILGKVLGGDKQQSTTTQELPAHIKAGQQFAITRGQELANRAYTPYGGQMIQGFNPMQMNAFSSANQFGNMGLGALGHGFNSMMDPTGANMMSGAYGGLMGQAFGQGGNEAPVAEGNYARFQTAGRAAQAKALEAEAVKANRDQIRDVDGQSFLQNDYGSIQDYMNPYTDSVIQGTTDDMERARQAQLQQGSSAAAAAGAFGGSRHGVQDALSNEAYFRNQGNMANAMRGQAFDAASGLLGQDLGRGLQAQMSNQGMDYNTEALNANLGTQTNQFNAGLGTQNNQFNAGARNNMRQFNAGQQNAMNQFNSKESNLMSMFNAGNELQNDQFGRGLSVQALQAAGGIGNNMANYGLNRGNLLTDFGIQGLGAQASAGDQIQGFGQSQLDNDYRQWIEARDWRANQAGYANDALRASGPGGAGTTTQDYFGPSYLQQGLGWGAMAQGVYGMGQDNGWWGGGGGYNPISTGSTVPGSGGQSPQDFYGLGG